MTYCLKRRMVIARRRRWGIQLPQDSESENGGRSLFVKTKVNYGKTEMVNTNAKKHKPDMIKTKSMLKE